MSADPCSCVQRRRDTEYRLTHDEDVWVASASAGGAPYLVALSFDWDGEALPQQRGDRFAAHTGFDPCALATPQELVPRLPVPHPGLARGERDA